jgi:type I restriction enzyme S subunit
MENDSYSINMKRLLIQKNIPHGWQEKKLDELSDIVNGSTPDTQKPIYWDGDINWYTPSDLKYQRIELKGSERKISEAGLKSIGSKIIPANSIILSTRAPIGYLGITKTKASLNQGCKGLIPLQNISEKFLYYSLFFNKKALNGLGSGSTFLELSSNNLASFTISLPPIKEQEKIAEILSKVDEDISKTENLIETTEKLKRGLMQQLFAHGIGQTKFKETPLGTITNISTGGTPKTDKKEYWGGDINWMASGEVNQKIVKFTEKRITKLGLDNCNSEILPKNTVMMALAGQGKTRGTVAILDIETSCNQSLAGIFTKDQNIILNEYIYYNLDFRYKELRNINGNEGRGGLNLQLLRALNISYPENIKIQKEIVVILSTIDEKISINKKLKEKLILLKKGLMSDLLSGKVRVN